jgi:hypothetical protein
LIEEKHMHNSNNNDTQLVADAILNQPHKKQVAFQIHLLGVMLLLLQQPGRPVEPAGHVSTTVSIRSRRGVMPC